MFVPIVNRLFENSKVLQNDINPFIYIRSVLHDNHSIWLKTNKSNGEYGNYYDAVYHLKHMLIVIIKLNARPDKCLELKQSLMALIEPTRKEKGCLSHNIFQDIENDNDLRLIQMWQTKGNLDDYLRSDLFTVLIGTRYLLSRPSEISVNEVHHASGWEAVEAARG